MQAKSQASGFTIIEILVSLLLFAVIIVSILPVLTNFFGSSRSTQNQMSDSALLQQFAEDLRRQWTQPGEQDPSDTVTESVGAFRLRNACVDSTQLTVPPGMTVSVVDLTPTLTGDFQEGAPYALAATCSVSRPTGTVRRVTLAFSDVAKRPDRLTLEMF
ncbi:type II secretion system protein J [Deinococcus hohokamensis]|uniref:Type II secretion system protein J n=1 Tax=Deinococcus hohokamensis TaxID=309883 RepID=A0ABV9I7Y8_9DEIO